MEDLELDPFKAQKSSDCQFKIITIILNRFRQSISITGFSFMGIMMSVFTLPWFEIFLGPARLLGFNTKNSGETRDHLASDLLWLLILPSTDLYFLPSLYILIISFWATNQNDFRASGLCCYAENQAIAFIKAFSLKTVFTQEDSSNYD